MTTETMIEQIKCGAYDGRLQELYVDNSKLERQRMRYIQGFVKNEVVAGYRKRMDLVFGEGACNVLKIRQYGGVCVTENTDWRCLDHIECGKL